MSYPDISYWNNKGKYQTLSDKLSGLIPDSGSVKNTSKNRKLEKYRKACNCYYDLYNNGLCNVLLSLQKCLVSLLAVIEHMIVVSSSCRCLKWLKPK